MGVGVGILLLQQFGFYNRGLLLRDLSQVGWGAQVQWQG